MLNTLKTQAMKRLFKLGLMLVSAFALTNCAEEINPPVQEDVNVDGNIESITPPEEEVDIPFEVFANFGESAETKTINWGNATYWEGTDAISVYHKPKGASTYTHNSRFTVADVNKGLFTGSLKTALGETNDWYFFYPYPEGSSSAPTLNAVPVTIGESVLNIQAGSKAHIVGDKSPMYGVLNEVEMGKSPDISMNHLAAVVALKIANNTDGPIDINEIVFKTQGVPLVGNFIADLTKINDEGKIQSPFREEEDKFNNNGTKEEVISPFKSNGNNPTSVTISCPGTQIQANGFETFYFAVCPNVHKINTFTILINGSEKVPQAVEDVVFEPGKVTTLRLNVDKFSTPLDNDALGYTFTGRKYQENGNVTKNAVTFYNVENDVYVPITQPTATVSINNTPVPIYVLGDGKTSIIRIEGKGSDLVNVLPATFYASRWNDKPTAMRLKKVDAYWKALLSRDWLSKGTFSQLDGILGINLDDGITPDDLTALGFGTSKLTFSGMIPNYSFNGDDMANSKVLMIDEERTSKVFDNAAGGNIESYLKIAGDSATMEGLIDIFNGNLSSSAAKSTGKTLYDFIYAKIKNKVQSDAVTYTAISIIGATSSSALMERLRDAQFYVEIETCSHPDYADQNNPIVFWGFDANIPPTSPN